MLASLNARRFLRANHPVIEISEGAVASKAGSQYQTTGEILSFSTTDETLPSVCAVMTTLVYQLIVFLQNSGTKVEGMDVFEKEDDYHASKRIV
jgi:hypothetical protein